MSVVKSTILLARNKLIFPSSLNSLELSLSQFTHISDLTSFLHSNISSDITFTNVQGQALNPSSSVKLLNSEESFLKTKGEVYKITTEAKELDISHAELFDSLHLSSTESRLLELNIIQLSKLFRSTSSISKHAIISSLNNCIRPGNTDYIKLSERYKELILMQNEMLEEFNQIKVIAEKHTWKMLWGWFAVLTLEWAYIGIGTYHYLSWDMMEPQAFVINSGNALLLYATYALKKQDLSREGFFKSISDRKILKLSQARNFDLNRFESISREIKEIKSKL